MCLTPLQPCGLELTRLLGPWNFPGKKSAVGCHFLFQEIFPGTKPTSILSPASAGILYHLSHLGSPGGSDSKESACSAEDPGLIPGLIPWRRDLLQDPLEKGMTTQSSFLAWRIPWTEEPGRLHWRSFFSGNFPWSLGP